MRSTLLLALGLFLSFFASAQEAPKAQLGEISPPLQLQTVQGNRSIALDSFRKSEDQPGRLVAITFWSYKCPSGRRALDRGVIGHIFDYCKTNGIEFIGICSYGEAARALADEADRRGVTYTLLHDPEYRGADLFGAGVVTSSYVLDREGRLVYEGALAGRRGGPGLLDALEDIVAGRPVDAKSTRPRG